MDRPRFWRHVDLPPIKVSSKPGAVHTEVYESAEETTKRGYNQAFFKKLYARERFRLTFRRVLRAEKLVVIDMAVLDPSRDGEPVSSAVETQRKQLHRDAIRLGVERRRAGRLGQWHRPSSASVPIVRDSLLP